MISAQPYSPPRKSENSSIFKYLKALYNCPDAVIKKNKDSFFFFFFFTFKDQYSLC